MKILFLVPYPLGEAPSQRFRFEQYIKILSDHQASVTVQSFLTSQNWEIMYSNGNIGKKYWALFSGFVRRFWILTKGLPYDFIFIHREATPIGPPVVEWFASKVLRKKIIYDFDDAIWDTDNLNEGRIEKLMRWRSKVKNICKWAYKVSCGNEYLADYARQFNKSVIVNPTTIDTELLHNPDHYKNGFSDLFTIGWTGSHSTLKYLDNIVPAIQQLEKKFNFRFLVIANKKPALPIQSLEFIPWSKCSEIEDLMKMNVGIMPLPDDQWAQGKCGFKILQYLSLKIPALASPVGVNTKIIQNGVNGFFCSNTDEWLTQLAYMINHYNETKLMGEKGRELIENNYSVRSNSRNFLSLFS